MAEGQRKKIVTHNERGRSTTGRKLGEAKHTMSSLVTEFLKDTTTHGIPTVVDDDWTLGDNFFLRKVCWFILWFTTIVLLIVYSINRYNYFRGYVYATQVDVETLQQIDFPSVTICPLNAINKLLKDDLQAETDILYNDVLTGGHELGDFMLKCEFNRNACTDSDSWETFVDKYYGNCFTFNASTLETSKRVVSEPNKDNGLTIRLLVNPDLYQSFTEELGFVVKAHASNVVPDMSDGVKIPTGYASEVKIRKFLLSRLALPYHESNPCTEASADNYNQPLCEHECINSKLIHDCGCGTGISELVDRQCVADDNACFQEVYFPEDSVLRNAEGVPCREECPTQCNEEKYDMKLSIADYPSKFNSRILTKAHSLCMDELASMFQDEFPICADSRTPHACESDDSCTEMCPHCYEHYIGDGYCDVDCLTKDCSFDGGDCGVTETRIEQLGLDLRDASPAALAEFESLYNSGWAPGVDCQALSIEDLVQRYLDHLDQAQTVADKNLAGQKVLRMSKIQNIFSSMDAYGIENVGDWVVDACGIPPTESEDYTTWANPPDDAYISAAWAEEKTGYVLLRVYYSEFNVESIKEAASYEWSNMLAELGGMYGLGAGISAMTLIEFAEFLVALVFFLFWKCTRGPGTQKVDPHQPPKE